MIEQHQLLNNDQDGDCLRACIASVLELPIEELPNPHGDDWWKVWQGWATARGLRFVHWDFDPEWIWPGLWIAGIDVVGMDRLHAVVARGAEIVFNPTRNFDPARVGEFRDVTIIAPLDPACLANAKP